MDASVETSTRTLFHQRSPTSKRPLTFFTVQKSNETRSMMVMKFITKFVLNHVQKRYVSSAAERKKR
jgi:hypothetical protein